MALDRPISRDIASGGLSRPLTGAAGDASLSPPPGYLLLKLSDGSVLVLSNGAYPVVPAP